jgi:hypothetical protein
VTEEQATAAPSGSTTSPRNLLLGTIGWLLVGVPFCYGLVQLVVKIPALFNV